MLMHGVTLKAHEVKIFLKHSHIGVGNGNGKESCVAAWHGSKAFGAAKNSGGDT